MDSCNKYGLMAEVYAQIIEKIIHNSNVKHYILRGFCEIYETELLYEIDPFCLNCDACITFLENQRIVYGYLLHGNDQMWVKKQEQHLRKVRGQARILSHLSSIQINEADFNRISYTPNHKLLVYLDHNVFDKYHKIEDVRNFIEASYTDINYVYSPSHLEEIKRMNDPKEEQQVIETIRKVTSSLIISNFKNNELSLAHEDPYFGLVRVMKNWGIAQDFEAYRVITTDDRRIFYPEYTDQNYLRQLSLEQVSDHPKVMAVCNQFEKHELLDERGRLKEYTYVHQAIYALVKALDDIGYKTDKKRAILSSAHDIEHMIYAAGTDIFVTMDSNFKYRSQFIYNKLGITTKVMNWIQYSEYVDTLGQN
ncbi:hypothetical protein JJQ72_14900 [Paenibacillus sp. F411]|uniref:hypothetical protein n=1 Tax=Paenibacillus sp. F411 TaxID=2820239 RepID=UPI001AAFD14B|nr:hypothetical protein [Paenibacillus sp. F411]MBO2945264.1 hypothetical protein [Paenibacillus sp. F411]